MRRRANDRIPTGAAARPLRRDLHGGRRRLDDGRRAAVDPRRARDVDSELQWVVSAYVLGYGGFVLLGGRAADLLGRRRMFLVWMAVFVVFSGLGGIASEGWLLIVARFVTGVAAGFMAPGRAVDHHDELPGGPRAQPGAAGLRGRGRRRASSLGMVVGGLLTAIDWRWVFFAPGGDGGAAAAWSRYRVVPRDDAARPPGSFDLGGALAITGAMILLVFTVVRAPDVALAPTLAGSPGTAALLTAFVVIERRASDAARAARHPAQRPHCCARTSARCCSSARSSPSSSSPCSTCRSCAAGRRWRPGWRWSCSGSTRSSRRRSPRGSSSASASCP